MKFISRSLFFRIFLSFWMTMILTGITLILTFVLQRNSVPERWRDMLNSTAHYSGTIALSELERGGTPAASAYIDDLDREGHLQSCLFSGTGTPIAGTHCSSFQEMARRVATAKDPVLRMRFGIARSATKLAGGDGRMYIFATDLPAGPRAAFGANRFSFALQWGVALLVSGCICYLLTRHITTPILRLREASQSLAAGKLGTRASRSMEHRRDELGALVNDFNRMAERMEQQVSSQRQLICDISHELRSPLARLNVALDLARRNDSAHSAFDHMEQDLDYLDKMIARLLTIARLDISSAPIELCPVNLSELVTQIVSNAEFESRQRNIQMSLTCVKDYWMEGNPELLHRAIENVVRNAILYTDEGTTVDVCITSTQNDPKPLIHLTVRDSGSGIPEAELANVFRPFYRVTESRDRQSGGVGLGLAIADRVVRLHHGSIRAENALPSGLQVIIDLPHEKITRQR